MENPYASRRPTPSWYHSGDCPPTVTPSSPELFPAACGRAGISPLQKILSVSCPTSCSPAFGSSSQASSTFAVSNPSPYSLRTAAAGPSSCPSPPSPLSSSKDHSLVFNPKFSLQSSSYSLNKYLLTSCCARHDTRCRRQSTEQNKPLTPPPKKKLPTLMELIFWCGVERQTI